MVPTTIWGHSPASSDGSLFITGETTVLVCRFSAPVCLLLSGTLFKSVPFLSFHPQQRLGLVNKFYS